MNSKHLRIAFWMIFPLIAIIVGVYFWEQKIPQKVDRYVKNMSHPHPDVAYDAWLKLNDLFFTKWEAYELVLDHVNEPQPISFLVEKTAGYEAGSGEIFEATSKPIYYKSDGVYCRTVGEAIMASILYKEKTKRKTPYMGDWQQWWEANKGYYGVLE